MKKKRLAALALLAPLLLLTACGSTAPLTLSANWYFSSSISEIEGTEEELEYDVTFTQRDPAASYTVFYDHGTYTTRLVSERYDSGEKPVTVYHYHTEFSITGHFIYKGSPDETFTDTSTADVWFLSARDELRPLKSEKVVHTSVPVATPSVTHLYDRYDYKYTFAYDAALKKAQYTYFKLEDANDSVGTEELSRSVKLSSSGTFFDNEQIFFGLRGLDMSAAATFRSIDPQTLLTVQLSTEKPSTQKDDINFTRILKHSNGESEEILPTGQLDTVQLKLSYKAAQPGPTRTLLYAKKTANANGNIYRNVLLKIENPISQALGTMIFTLTKATFNDK